LPLVIRRAGRTLSRVPFRDIETPMRAVFGITLAAAALTLAGGCGGNDRDKDGGGGPGSAALEGTYLLVGMEGPMGKLDEDALKKAGATDAERTWTFKGNQVTCGRKGGRAESGLLHVDSKKNPPEIDIALKDEPVSGVYRSDGDTLTIYAARNAEQRPRELRGTDKTVTLTLRKQ